MHDILKYLITLPILALPAIAGVQKPAFAGTVTPAAALELLAESSAADRKCKFLVPGDSDELASYLARAEVAAAERMSLSTAQASIATGKARGTASACGETDRAAVGSTLSAAREAMAAVESGRVRDEPEDEPRAAAAEPAPKIFKKHVANLEPVKRLPPRALRRDAKALTVTGSMRRYAVEAAAYYADRKCRMLSQAQAKTFWNGIVGRHKAALAAHGKRAVAAVLAEAESSASGWNCGERTALAIKQGLDSVAER